MRDRSSPPGLVGLLESWGAVDIRAPRVQWAEHWSTWLGPLDAITLSSALPDIRSARTAPASGAKRDPVDLTRQLHALQDDLTRYIRQGPTPLRAPAQSGTARAPLAATVPAAVVDWVDEGDYGSYRQRYLDIQRRFELRIDPFRAYCRQVLTHSDSRLCQLAQLDLTLESLLASRTQTLLASLAALMERRFQRYQQDEDLPAEGFEQDFQHAMLAELQFRLEPVTGLVEAWRTGA